MSLSKKAAKAKTVEVKLSVLDWCKEQVAQDRELSIHWEGGGDSGWVHFEIDGETVDNDYTQYLISAMYDQLDYGSWAGEFTAHGSATFSLEENAFVGTDYYQEDERMLYSCDISFKVPNGLWYDSLHYRVECSGDESVSSDVSFSIKNGFLTDEHIEIQRVLEDVLDDEVPKLIEKFIDEGKEFRDLWISEGFLKTDGEDKGAYTEFKITELGMGTYTSEEKDIFLYVEENKTPEDKN